MMVMLWRSWRPSTSTLRSPRRCCPASSRRSRGYFLHPELVEEPVMQPAPSAKPVLQKLHLKPGYRAFVLKAPESYQTVLADWPDDVERAEDLSGEFDFIHTFAIQSAELAGEAPRLKAAL